MVASGHPTGALVNEMYSAFDVDTGAKLMTIGLGTYAFFWQWHDTAENPLTLAQMIDRTADLGVKCVPDLRLPPAGVLRTR